MISNIPGNTQEYPEIPESKKIPENTQSYISTLLPDPDPTCYSKSSQFQAVYCHSFFQSRSVLEITLQTVLTVYKFNTLPLYKKECLDIWLFGRVRGI